MTVESTSSEHDHSYSYKQELSYQPKLHLGTLARDVRVLLMTDLTDGTATGM